MANCPVSRRSTHPFCLQIPQMEPHQLNGLRRQAGQVDSPSPGFSMVRRRCTYKSESRLSRISRSSSKPVALLASDASFHLRSQYSWYLAS